MMSEAKEQELDQNVRSALSNCNICQSCFMLPFHVSYHMMLEKKRARGGSESGVVFRVQSSILSQTF